jgi:hypothetical protein
VAAAPALAPSALPAEETACATLLRDGRFAELLVHADALEDADARTRWLAACSRLALPRLLAEHAIRMPASAERDALLAVALERWALDAPAALGEWAATHADNDRIVDGALAQIVEHTDALSRPTADALAWTRLIHDPALRLRALQAVVREWAARDPDAALHFAETAPELAHEQRATLLATLLPAIPET